MRLGSWFLVLDYFTSPSTRRRALPAHNGQLTTTMKQAIDYEISRARRYGGSVSAVAVAPGPGHGNLNGSWTQFTSSFADSMREMDTCWLQDQSMVVLLPETDLIGRSHVVRRMLQLAGRQAIDLQLFSSTFPEEVATADGMLARLLDGDEDGTS